jgi:ubiquinone/menaquinone biosynthesis C-methylase UbiE
VGINPMEGWQGWDEYAPFYDWENSQTVGRQDIPFLVDLAVRSDEPVLELGCGTGRVFLPVARRVERFVGIDRSAAMLNQLSRRFRRTRLRDRVDLVRGDIRALLFRKRVRFKMIRAPYGMLQSLLRDRDLIATFRSVSKVVARGGWFFGRSSS